MQFPSAHEPQAAVLFDLDGTLLDTLSGLAASVNYALRVHGEPERTLDEVRRFVGNGARRLIVRALGGEAHSAYETVLADFRAHYNAHAAEGAVPYPGIPELLDALRVRGIALGVVTNKDEGVSRALVERFFPGAFAAVAGGGTSRPPKPDPAGAFEALRALGASPDATLYVGDSDVDAATANAAGLRFVLCSWGFRPRETLVPLGPVVDRPGDILAFLGQDEKGPGA